MNAPTDSPATPRRAGWMLVLVLMAFIALFQWQRGGRAKPVFCEQNKQPSADTVVMLSASWCGYCARARQMFVDEHIDYCEYDIEKSAEGARRHQASGVRGVPVIFIKDDVVYGFEPAAVMKKLLAYHLVPLKD